MKIHLRTSNRIFCRKKSLQLCFSDPDKIKTNTILIKMISKYIYRKYIVIFSFKLYWAKLWWKIIYKNTLIADPNPDNVLRIRIFQNSHSESTTHIPQSATIFNRRQKTKIRRHLQGNYFFKPRPNIWQSWIRIQPLIYFNLHCNFFY